MNTDFQQPCQIRQCSGIPGMIACERDVSAADNRHLVEESASFVRRSHISGSPFSRRGLVCVELIPENTTSPLQDDFDVSDRPALYPTWMQDPMPMTGWTHYDQRILLSAIDAHPNAHKHPEHLKLLFVRIHRKIPHKSIADIEKCFKYIEMKQTAYFSISAK
jgi:hypothetical protein